MQHCFSIHLIPQRNAMFEKIIKLFQHQLCVTRLISKYHLTKKCTLVVLLFNIFMFRKNSELQMCRVQF